MDPICDVFIVACSTQIGLQELKLQKQAKQ